MAEGTQLETDFRFLGSRGSAGYKVGVVKQFHKLQAQMKDFYLEPGWSDKGAGRVNPRIKEKQSQKH